MTLFATPYRIARDEADFLWPKIDGSIVLIPKLRTDGVRGMVHLHDLDRQFDIGVHLLGKWGALE
jgi:hypothetical protein